MPNTHSLLSPSSADRWFNCPGSINLIRTLPETAFKSSKYAAEGSVAHQLAEDFVTGKIDYLTLTSRIGETVMHDDYEIEITDAMIEGVQEYADYITEIRKRLKKPSPVIGKAEVRVHAKTLGEDLWGTADYLLYQRGHELHVFDFKFGKGTVEAAENAQGLIYIIGAQDTESGTVFDKVFFHIIQPRARHADGTIRMWEVPKDYLAIFRIKLAVAVAATQEQTAIRIAGSWCKFCPALGYCAEAAGAVQAAAGEVFTQLPAPPSKEVGVTMLPPVATLSKAQVSGAMEWEDTLDSWFEALRARMLAELTEDPNAYADWKLVEGKTNRAWSDSAAVEAAFSLLGDSRYAPRKLLSPAQLEKVAGKEAIAPYVVKPAGKPTVAKSTDKRQTMTPVGNAADVFEPIKIARSLPEDSIFGDLMGQGKIWP